MALIERRIGFLFAVFLAALGLALLKAVWLGVVKQEELASAAATQQRQTLDVPARRGAITDRRGIELAVSQPATSIAATPYLIEDPLKASRQIGRIVGADPDELLQKLSKKDTGFVWLARKVPESKARRVKKLDIAGLEFVPEARRVYPRRWMASQLLGIVGTDNVGLAGLELAHDDALKGSAGKRFLVKDALNRPIELRDEVAARPGDTLRLTLDAAIQDRTEEVLAEVGAKWQPKAATAIVMNPQTGELLAVANWPQVDANDVSGAPDYAKQNRAVASTYEPGSTFKAFTVAGALEEKDVEPNTEFTLAPTIQLYDRVIGESHPRGTITLTTKGILEQSSNVGAIKIGLTLGADKFDEWVRRFGFGSPTGVDLPGEERGILLDRKNYSGASMGNLPIGQGLAVTPMQMATAYAAIANGGILRPPRVVSSVGGRKVARPRGRRVIKAETAAALRDMLEGVLGPGGTATPAAIDGYHLAGKTGTAQKPDPTTGGYSETNYIASFIGFAPADRPQLLVNVMVDEPKGEIYGGVIAAPAWRKITSFALNYLKIPPQ